MYESPVKLIVSDITLQVDEKLEEACYTAVMEYFPNVDREELIRALRYDRQQYEQGYQDGFNAAKEHGCWVGVEYDGYADGCPVYHLWECSCCRDEYESEGDPPSHDYCPSCGAKMDLEPPKWEESE